jgi:hypothetical protein
VCFRVGLITSAMLAGSIAALAQGGDSTANTAPPANSEKSVAAAAKEAKAQKAHAKKVFTDEDMGVSTNPLPRLKMLGTDNTDVIIAAIGKYKESHTGEETEQVVHDWYDDYDQQLAAAIEDNLERTSLMRSNVDSDNEACMQGGYDEKCAGRRMADATGARRDQNVMMDNNALIHRLQNAFSKIRGGIGQYGLHYDWWKIRTTNNIDTY